LSRLGEHLVDANEHLVLTNLRLVHLDEHLLLANEPLAYANALHAGPDGLLVHPGGHIPRSAGPCRGVLRPSSVPASAATAAARATEESPLRIGILGAARIVPTALVAPARRVPEVTLAAVAARDTTRAAAFAKRHGIERVLASYDALLDDPAIDAVYVPLPNALHCAWTLRALAAGKHVLCEKPLASNAREAQEMAAAAARAGRVLMEAFHWRYHPLAARIVALATGGTLGKVQRIETSMCIPLPLPGNIRYDLALGGGATMDTGCYAIHMLRHLAGAEPAIVRAEARLSSHDVDRCMEAEMTFSDGRTGRMQCSLFSARLLDISARVVGDRGEMRVLNPVAPQYYHRLVVRTPDGKRVERVPGHATYEHQLRAFADAVRTGVTPITGPADAIANMRVIDAVYDAAGLPRRGERAVDNGRNRPS
jgi:predicted dehydrogenase